jgi:hypothetical protein
MTKYFKLVPIIILFLITIPIPYASGAPPVNFDLRNHYGDAPALNNIGACGSQWAMSAISSVEWLMIKEGKKVELSAQALIDCIEDSGCGGGFANSALNFLRDSGTTREIDYPYTRVDGTCQPYNVAVKITSFQNLNSYTTDQIKSYIYDNGHPTIAHMDFYTDLYSYTEGIYQHTPGSPVGSHNVLIIGWGYDEASDTDYWICENNWGPLWGENGYFKIKIGDSDIGVAYNYFIDGITILLGPIADAGSDKAGYDTITLDGSGSYHDLGAIISYDWELNHTENSDFDTITTGETPVVSGLHPGIYNVRLTVLDDLGLTDEDWMILGIVGRKGDFDFDGVVDGYDLSVFANEFGH